MQKLQSYLILSICVLAWGSSYVAIKIGLEGFLPSQVASYRLSVAGIISLAFIVFGQIRLPSLQQFKQIFLIAFFGIFIYHISITYFTVFMEPNVVSFIANTAPIFILIFSHFILKESLRSVKWIGFLLALIGIGFMNYQDGLSLDWKDIGPFIIPITGALFFVLQKPLLKEMKSTHMMHWCIVLGAVLLLIWDASFINNLEKAPFESHFAIIYLGIIPTVVAFQLWAHLLSSVNVSLTASPIYLIPSSTLVFSIIFLNQLPDWATILGGTITILGVAISKRKTKNEA